MSMEYSEPLAKDLIAEQERVQASKFQGRMLDDYDHFMFPGQFDLAPKSSAVTDFLRPYCADERVSISGVLEGIAKEAGRPAHWVEMGGGRGLAMRQLAAVDLARSALRMTNVDLFDFDMTGLKESEITSLEAFQPGITSAAARPQLIRADVESVALSNPADLITSVEVVQYLNNPLEAMCNWYNQLNDNGMLMITAERNWSEWIRYSKGAGCVEGAPCSDLLAQLEAAGVPYAASDEDDWEGGFRPRFHPNRFRKLVIQRQPGTSLQLHTQVESVWVNPHDFKAVYYEEPKEALVELLY